MLAREGEKSSRENGRMEGEVGFNLSSSVEKLFRVQELKWILKLSRIDYVIQL